MNQYMRYVLDILDTESNCLTLFQQQQNMLIRYAVVQANRAFAVHTGLAGWQSSSKYLNFFVIVFPEYIVKTIHDN